MASCLINTIFKKNIWPIYVTKTGTIVLVQSWPRSNGNEEVFHTPQNCRTEASDHIDYCAIPRTIYVFKYSSVNTNITRNYITVQTNLIIISEE